jgi:predicted TPR repeat methyltransferase
MSRVSADRWLEDVYGATSRSELADLYDVWACTYDTDMLSIGYSHPAVMMGLAARYIPSQHATILDAGVGTGLLGHLLSILGYTDLHGIDISHGMLAKAKSRSVYTELRNRTLGEKLDYADATFDAVISTGTFTTGHAPAAAFDELTRIVKPGGYLIFTVGTTTWLEQGFATKFTELERAGRVQMIETTPTYAPMPHSKTESGFTTRAFVYRKM